MLAKFQNDMKQAMKSGDKEKLSTLRMLISAVQYTIEALDILKKLDYCTSR
jgi:uncharacterized protein YqeY